jgi:hypothetical protein
MALHLSRFFVALREPALSIATSTLHSLFGKSYRNRCEIGPNSSVGHVCLLSACSTACTTQLQISGSVPLAYASLVHGVQLKCFYASLVHVVQLKCLSSPVVESGGLHPQCGKTL